MSKRTVRMDTSLESAGAEFLVLGNLLVEGIEAHKLYTHKSYTNYPGNDIVAVESEKNSVCRIQVKSRWATDFDGRFPIRNFNCDFVVFVALNRGYRYRRKSSIEDSGQRDPRFYVFPIEVIRSVRNPDDSWGKVFLKNIEKVEGYISGWDAIRAFLTA